MPSWVRDEDKWKDAKTIVNHEYDIGEDDPKFWKLVAGVYKKMGGRVGAAGVGPMTKSIAVFFRKAHVTRDQIKAGMPPSIGDKIEFLNDRLTDKGPSAGIVTDAKTTVDGHYIKVKHSDAEQWMSWEDMRGKAEFKPGIWLIKTMDIYQASHEPTIAQLEAGNYKKRKIKWNGLTISIENPAGSVRRGVDRDGHAWEQRMLFDYGYLNRTEGSDNDHVDCYIGPHPDASHVYIVHQRKAGNWMAYDEDKCMLSFASRSEAIAAYLKHYDDPRFLGPVTEMPVAEFKEKVLRANGKMIKSIMLFLSQNSS